MTTSESKSFSFPKDEPQWISGLQKKMLTHPEVIRPSYKGRKKLEGKVALITGGDSGIGRRVPVHFPCEIADIAIDFLPQEIDDANETK